MTNNLPPRGPRRDPSRDEPVGGSRAGESDSLKDLIEGRSDSQTRAEAMLNEFLDRRPSPGARRNRAMAEQNELLASALRDAEPMLRELERAPGAPDLTGRVLTELELREPLHRTRRRATDWWRVSIYTGLAAAIAAAIFWGPGLPTFPNAPRPVDPPRRAEKPPEPVPAPAPGPRVGHLAGRGFEGAFGRYSFASPSDEFASLRGSWLALGGSGGADTTGARLLRSYALPEGLIRRSEPLEFFAMRVRPELMRPEPEPAALLRAQPGE
ncbi:MAG: hypothetical protein SFY95_01350 [Planctomycetota bacterium]|nr:hypothetical protein [Planctomycetota bacterium]